MATDETPRSPQSKDIDPGELKVLQMRSPTSGGFDMRSVRKGGKLRAFLNYIDRSYMMRSLGISFGGRRDLWESFGWDRELNLNQIMDMYLRGGIAKRVIDAKCESTWGRPPKIYLPNQNEWMKQVAQLIWQTDLWHYMKRVDVLAGLGRYAILVIGTNRGKLDSPLPTGGSGGLKITYLQPYSEIQARIKEWDQDPTSPRFGLPTMYTIMNMTALRQIQSVGTADIDVRPQGSSYDVHYSRVIHVCKNGLTNDVFGIPEFAPIWNYLTDLMKVIGASSESYWRHSYPGLHMDVDKDMDLDDEDEANLTAEADDFQHDLRRMLRTRGVKVQALASSPADPRGAFNVLVDLVAGSTGIPRRILLGSEAGQLASTQDKANWAERIEEYREVYAEPRLIWPFIQWVVQNKIVSLPADTDLSTAKCLWPDAYRMSPLERSQTSAQIARSLANIAKGIAPIEMEPAVDPIPADPGTPDTTDPITGEVKPGRPATPGVPGKPAVTQEPLISRDEARVILGFSTDQQLLTNMPDDIA